MLKDKWDYMEVLCKQNGYWGIISIVACKNCHNQNSSTQQEKKQFELKPSIPHIYTIYWAHDSITPFSYVFLRR